MALTDLFARSRKDEMGNDVVSSPAPVRPTLALAPFIAGLGVRQPPVVLDLGPVVESNVRFFGEELGCRIVVEDLSSEIERHLTRARTEDLSDWLDRRFPPESDTVDGILCWDLFDYLDRVAAERLARRLARVLRPDGVLLAFFSTADPRSTIGPTYTRHVVLDRARLECQPCRTGSARQRPWTNRELKQFFEPLRVEEMFLLDTNVREVLFRKPLAAGTDMFAAPPSER